MHSLSDSTTLLKRHWFESFMIEVFLVLLILGFSECCVLTLWDDPPRELFLVLFLKRPFS